MELNYLRIMNKINIKKNETKQGKSTIKLQFYGSEFVFVSIKSLWNMCEIQDIWW